jgi:alkanesulfonate monooxygenase SsuD/methylene tetrahydromethanopterin reductase-like flavin-dependent oxidoreductase (luciferase family)
MPNPLFSDNKLKLGLFSTNVSNGGAISTVSEALKITWPTVRQIAQIADRDGYEALVPVARWRGFGGETDFNGTCYETYTWAAGLGEATRDIGIFTTSHVPTVHPILAAKQATTIDHITNGRFALNIVCGWFKPELEMFGAPIMEHDIRYDYAAEWVEILKMLWTRDDEFDYDGKYLQVKKAYAKPKPIQQPHPPLMNAGGSDKGRHFAAKYCDMAFVILNGQSDVDESRRIVDHYRKLAYEEYGRDLQIWTNAYVVQRDTQQEAEEYLKHYVVDCGDDVAVENLLNVLVEQSAAIPQEIRDMMKFHVKAGWGGFPLVGTADKIVADLQNISKAGVNGVLLNWVDYVDGLERWNRDVMPRLEQAGLRKGVRAAAHAS